MSPSGDVNEQNLSSAKQVSTESKDQLLLSQKIHSQAEKIKELESLIQTISRGKYMWEATFDAITSPVMMVDSSYTILRANTQAASDASIDVRKMIGKKCYEVLAGFKKPCARCPLDQTIKSETHHSTTLDSFSNGKEYVVNAYPLTINDEKQIVLNYRDVSGEKELQRKLIQSEKLGAIGMLAGGVAHEINNPLGGILAFAQLAMRSLEKNHSAQSDLKEIEEAALRCKRIVSDLLDFSRQNQKEKMETVRINEVIRKILPLVQVQIKNSQVEIDCKLQENLPPIAGVFHQLQQVFLNLITNGYQAMKDKGGVLTLVSYVEDNQVQVKVTDTGVGIDSENIEKIFDPYFTTKKQGEGTGLGLSISYGIVKEHLGEIEVSNNINGGASFIVKFPIKKSEI